MELGSTRSMALEDPCSRSPFKIGGSCSTQRTTRPADGRTASPARTWCRGKSFWPRTSDIESRENAVIFFLAVQARLAPFVSAGLIEQWSSARPWGVIQYAYHGRPHLSGTTATWRHREVAAIGRDGGSISNPTARGGAPHAAVVRLAVVRAQRCGLRQLAGHDRPVGRPGHVCRLAAELAQAVAMLSQCHAAILAGC